MISDANRIIQGLWIGPKLSAMEQLSISSFLQNGHDYHLYVYEDVKNVPAGVVIRDAAEILPASRIFQYQGSPSYAGFANYFRYKLLLERGGWWVDTDTICLKPFDFTDDYVFSSQLDERGMETVNNGIIKAPPGSEAMAYALEVCQTKDPSRLVWGETGPRLMVKVVKKFSLEQYPKTHHVFCPIDYPDWRDVLRPGVGKLIDDRTYAIHLWNEMWRAAGQDKSAQYHPNCLYEALKRTYLPIVSVAGAPA